MAKVAKAAAANVLRKMRLAFMRFLRGWINMSTTGTLELKYDKHVTDS
jgi:hypothetical protein